MNKLCHGLPNVSGIDNDILIAGFVDLGRDNDETVGKVIDLWGEANLKLNKDKCHLRCTNNLFFEEVISWNKQLRHRF